MAQKFLDSVYDKGNRDVREIYADWSKTYDAEIAENGYATPMRAASALADSVQDKSRPVLDFGCGTGLSGLALKSKDFSIIDGIDVTPEMIAVAQSKGVYRIVHCYGLTDPIPVDLGAYAAISAVGVISPGAAPIEVFEMIVTQMNAGAHFVFSFNDHALVDPRYEASLKAFIDAGTLALVFQEYGDHLPGIGLRSTVYVVEKL